MRFARSSRPEIRAPEAAADADQGRPRAVHARCRGSRPPASPGITPRPHRGLVNHLALAARSTIPPVDMIDERLLHEVSAALGT